MAAFFADVAQVIAAIFWFLIVIVKPVSLFFNRQNAWVGVSQKRGSENALHGHSRLFSMPDKVSIHFSLWILKNGFSLSNR